MNKPIIILLLLLMVIGWSDWQPIGPDGGNIQALALDYQYPNVLYAVPYEAPNHPRLYQTTNGGTYWNLISTVDDEYVLCLAVDQHQSNILYAFGRSSYLHRSTNNGINWNSITVPGIGNEIKSDPLVPGRVYAAGSYNIQAALLISTDYGLNWTQSVPDTYRGTANCCAVDPIDTGTVYLGSAYSRLYRSTDAGANWELRNTGFSPDISIHSLTINPTNSDIILGGTSSGMYRTTDAGQAWSSVSSIALVFKVVFSQAASNIGYALGYVDTTVKFYISTDTGITWTSTTPGMRLDKGAGFIIDPSAEEICYAYNTKGIFKTIDFGNHWQTAHQNIRIAKISTIAVSSRDNRRIYLESYENGVFKSSSGGDTWTRCEDFLSCGNICGIGLAPGIDIDTIYALEGVG